MNIDRMDADLLAAELTRLGNRSAALRRRGICDHGWTQATGKDGHGNADFDGPTKCLRCGKQFPTFAALCDERREALS